MGPNEISAAKFTEHRRLIPAFDDDAQIAWTGARGPLPLRAGRIL